MNGLVLLESLQYVEDGLLEEGEAPARRVSPWRRWGAVAACLAVLLCAGLLLRGVLGNRVGPASGLSLVSPAPTAFLTLPEPSGYVNVPQTEPGSAWEGLRPDPAYTAPPPGTEVGTPGNLGPYTEQPAEPEVFLWTEQLPASVTGDSVAGEVILVGQALTEEQAAACAPETRPEWMEDFSGSATYKLRDGSGGLLCVQLYVPHEELGSTCRVTLLEATPERLAAFGLDAETLPSWDGQGYRAFRDCFAAGDGEDVTLLVAFARAGVLYTLRTDVPAGLEKYAAIDLRDLLLAYAGSAVPDLGSFVYHTGG